MTASRSAFVGSIDGFHSPLRQPVPRIQRPAGVSLHGGRDARDRFVERARSLEPHLPLRERPLQEVHVRVGEAGDDAAAAEIHDLRRCERRLVSADAAGDPVAGDRERPRDGQRRVEGADDAVLEDHGARI